MIRKMEFLPIVLILVAVAFFAQTHAAALSNRDAVVRSAMVRQFLDRYVPGYDHVVMRRFDLNFPSSNVEEDPRLAKRNNAELVNHIIKNFGTLDRLGDVGK